MTVPTTNKLSTVFPIMIDKYEQFIPNIEGMGVPDKINAIIQYLNRIGKLSNDVVSDWNKVMVWVMDEGLTDNVNAKIDDMVAKGTFNDLLNGMFDVINADVTDFKNTVNGQVNTLTSSLAESTQRIKDISVNIEDFPIQVPETDDSARIQRAHDSLNGQMGILYFPKASYTVNSAVNLNLSNVTISGNGFNTVITSSQNNNIFYVTGHYVIIKDIKLTVTSTNRTKYTIQAYNTNKTMLKNVYFDNTGNSLSGMWFNGGSMGLVENCMFNHSRINIGTWDVKIDKTYIWALSQDYGIGITNGAGNTTLTNIDVVPPFRTVSTRKAGIWIDSSVSACLNTKMTNIYIDGNPSLVTGVGVLISPNTGIVLISDFSSNMCDDDVIVIDSAYSVTVERGLFYNNNNNGLGFRDVYIKRTGTQNPSKINIRNNQFVQTTTITGTIAPSVEVDLTTITDQSGIKIEFNDINQPTAGGAYVDPEIKVDYTTIQSLRGNDGTLSKYRRKGGSMAVSSGVTSVTISALSTYPIAYESLIGRYTLQAEGFIMPNYRIQKVNRNSITVVFETATTASGTLYWSVEL